MKEYKNKPAALWLYWGAIGILIQIVLGGITRLTGSGLSITEWKPLLGILPPLNTADWEKSFDAYKQIAQFKVVNAHFTIADYKSIFFWEWLHRNWARFLSILFIIPCIVLCIKGYIHKAMHFPLGILFLLGVLQGAIGWIMVKSGLNDTAIAVNDIKLAIHFITAIVLLCYTLWMAFKLSAPYVYIPFPLKIRNTSAILLLLILLQLFYGALMAGSKAALSAPTWPDMNGYFIPPTLYSGDSATAYPLIVQFVHRLIAIMIAVLIIIFYIQSSRWKYNVKLNLLRKFSVLLILIQIALGVYTLLNSFATSYAIYAILHQFIGLLLCCTMLFIFYLAQRASESKSCADSNRETSF